MGQEQVVNNQGIGEIVLFLTGGDSTRTGKIVCIKTACSAATASGYSNYTQSAASGLTMAAIATISASSASFTNDTVHIVHPFTAAATETVKGHMIVNNEATPDALYSVCCYAGDITVESGDTITVTHDIRLKNG